MDDFDSGIIIVVAIVFFFIVVLFYTDAQFENLRKEAKHVRSISRPSSKNKTEEK